MLDAWSQVVPETGNNAILAMVGNGPMLDSVSKEIGSRQLTDSVVLAGETKDVLSWYRAADIFVMTSHLEGLSNSMLEALACGLPLVATRVSGCVEAVREGRAGILAEANDMGALAKGLITLLRDSQLRQQYGRAARGHILARYNLDQIVDQMMEMYRTLS